MDTKWKETDRQTEETSQGRSWKVCALIGAGILFVMSMLAGVTGEIYDEFLVMFFCGIFSMVLAVIFRYQEVRERFFLVRAFRWFKGKITGEAYWQEGMESWYRKRFRFTLGTLISLPIVAMICLLFLMMNGAGGKDSVVLLFPIFLFLTLWVIRQYYKGGYQVSSGYERLRQQLDRLCEGEEFEPGREPLDVPDNTLFAEQSEKLNQLDVRMREQVRRQVRAEKMKIELITNVSHDLKTPLTSIISYIDLLSKEDLGDTAADYVKVLQKKSEYLGKMIHDVFDLSKASSGNLEIRQERVDVAKLLIQTLADMEQEVNNAPGKLVTEISEDAGVMDSDGEKLYRVLQNVIGNALKYSLTGTRIFVRLERKAETAVLTVRNVAGYEMNFTEEEVLGRFFRGDKARSTEGTGLGLAIAKEFAELCGGRLAVDIQGDVFEVTIHFPVQVHVGVEEEEEIQTD